MKSKVASLVLAGLITPLAIAYPGIFPGKETRADHNQAACDPNRAGNVSELLPCAWGAAQKEVEQRYPALTAGINQLKRPEVAIRQGPWFDRELGDYVDGDTDLENDPPITLGVTGDVRYDYHTAIHEYKHAIIDMMRLGEEAHRWVDSDDDVPDSDN